MMFGLRSSAAESDAEKTTIESSRHVRRERMSVSLSRPLAPSKLLLHRLAGAAYFVAAGFGAGAST